MPQRSFFGRIQDALICFWYLLTFSTPFWKFLYVVETVQMGDSLYFGANWLMMSNVRHQARTRTNVTSEIFHRYLHLLGVILTHILWMNWSVRFFRFIFEFLVYQHTFQVVNFRNLVKWQMLNSTQHECYFKNNIIHCGHSLAAWGF